MKSWFLSLLLVLASTAVFAQEARVEAEIDSLLDVRREYEGVDARLNEVWAQLKESLHETYFATLLEDQRKWLEYRDSMAPSDATAADGMKFHQREKESVYYWKSLFGNTQNRLSILNAWLSMAQDDEEIPWEGVWVDDYGGTLYVMFRRQEPETSIFLNEIEFEISVVRGPTYHLGAMEGIAQLNGNLAFHRDGADDSAPDFEELWLFFEKHDHFPTLKLRGVNTGKHHGARAYFDGTYTRIEPMTDELRARIEKRNAESLLTGEE